MELSPSTLKNIACTLDYKIQPTMMDKKGEIIAHFIEDLSSYEILSENRLKMEDTNKTWNIVVEPNRYGQVSKKFDNIENFSKQVYKYAEVLMNVLEIQSFTRIGVREFHEIKLSDDGEFRPLKNYFDIPGIETHLNGLIHYQVSLEIQKQRIVITLGQNKRENEIFLIPDINGMTFHEISISELCSTIKKLHNSAHEKYNDFALTI